jgi:iron complex outermembrane receptor protein
MPDFNVTLDWYRFNIESAIARVAVANVLRFCANAAVPEACARTSRTATGELLNVDVSVLNSGVLEVEGFDLGANWHIDTDLGRFDLQWDSTYSTRYRSEVPRGAGERSALGNNFAFEPGFRMRANLDLAWRRGEWSAAAGLRYYPALDEACIGPSNAGYESLCSRPGIESPTHFGYPENRLGARVYVDLQAAWDAPFGARILLGVHNAFDRDPPVSYAAFANSFDPSYPIPGRYWYLGWQVKL